MEKLKVKEIIRRFFCICDIEAIKKSIWVIHKSLMMSDRDIAIEERQRFTFAGRQIADLLNDLTPLEKKYSKKCNDYINTLSQHFRSTPVNSGSRLYNKI